MRKVLAKGATTVRQSRVPAEGRVVEFPGAAERSGRSFVCTVLYLDLVEYSKMPIGEQMQAKERYNTQVSQAIAEFPATDRIVLDTGDGVAISFLGDPEDALFVALALAPGMAANAAIPARIGINLGPVRLTRDINGQPNIVGDGINVAQRVVSFARPGQILVSRGFHEVIARIAQDYVTLFSYQGSRTDTHVREHEIFELSAPLKQATEVALRHLRARRQKLAHARSTGAGHRGLLRNRTLAYAVTAGSCTLLVAALYSTLVADAQWPRPSPAAAPGPPAHSIVVATPTAASEAAAALVPGAPRGDDKANARALARVPGAKLPLPRAKSTNPAAASAPQRAAGVEATSARGAHAKPRIQLPAPLNSTGEPPADPALGKPVPEHPVAIAPAGPTARGGLLDSPKTPSIPVTTAPGGPTARVMLAISPWGEVLVDGQSMGVSPPLAELALSPGKHRIVVRNGDFEPLQQEVELDSNETVRVKHRFNRR